MCTIPLWTDHWDIVEAFITRPRLFIACDFDGTLSRIVEHPEEAVLGNEVRGLVRKLREMCGVTVAVISGRAVSDLRRRVGIDGVLYAGNHGLEIDAPGILWASAEAREHRPELSSALAELRKEIGSVPGRHHRRQATERDGALANGGTGDAFGAPPASGGNCLGPAGTSPRGRQSHMGDSSPNRLEQRLCPSGLSDSAEP